MYGNLLAFQRSTYKTESELRRICAEDEVRLDDDSGLEPIAAPRLREVLHHRLCFAFAMQLSISSGAASMENSAVADPDYIVEHLQKTEALVDKLASQPLSSTAALAICRQLAIGAYLESNWKYTIALLNGVVTRCCADVKAPGAGLGGGAEGSTDSAGSGKARPPLCLIDASLMLTDAYFRINRVDDAMHCARLSVDIVHARIEWLRTAPPGAVDEEDIGPCLPLQFALVCSYFNLAKLLDRLGLMQFGLDWYRRALVVAEANVGDGNIVRLIRECISAAEGASGPKADGGDANVAAAKTESNPVSVESAAQDELKPMNAPETRKLSEPREPSREVAFLQEIGKSKSATPRLFVTPESKYPDITGRQKSNSVESNPYVCPPVNNRNATDNKVKVTKGAVQSDLHPQTRKEIVLSYDAEAEGDGVIDVSSDDLYYSSNVLGELERQETGSSSKYMKDRGGRPGNNSSDHRRGRSTDELEDYFITKHINNRGSSNTHSSRPKSRRRKAQEKAAGGAPRGSDKFETIVEHVRSHGDKGGAPRVRKEVQHKSDASNIMNYAAMIIGAAARGYIARKFVGAVKRHKYFLRRHRMQSRGLIKLQSVARMFLARRRVERIKNFRVSLVNMALITAKRANPSSHLPGASEENALVGLDVGEVISSAGMVSMIRCVKAERQMIQEKQNELIAVSNREKRRLVKVLDSLSLHVPAEKKKMFTSRKAPDETVGLEASQEYHATNERMEHEYLNVSKELPDNLVVLCTLLPKYQMGQKVEAKYMGCHLSQHNVTWHAGRILHIHKVYDRVEKMMTNVYDVVFANGEVELRVNELYIRPISMKFSKFNVAGGPSEPKNLSQISSKRRIKNNAEMHKTMMQFQAGFVKRRPKRMKERSDCRNHNIRLIQKIARGYLVRRNFCQFRIQLLERRIAAKQQASSDDRQDIKLQGTLVLRQKKTVISYSTGVGGDPSAMSPDELDKTLNEQNKLLNKEIQEYYNMLIQCQCELQELRNMIHANPSTEIARTASADGTSVQRSYSSRKGGDDASEVIPQLSVDVDESARHFEGGMTPENYSRVDNADVAFGELNSLSVSQSGNWASQSAGGHQNIIKSIVSSYISDAISSTLNSPVKR